MKITRCAKLFLLLLILGITIFNSVLAGKDETQSRVIRVNVVAIDQPVFYNRFGSVNPYTMMYALERDVMKFDGKEMLPGLNCPYEWRLIDEKRPRPLVLRGNIGDILEIKFTNRLLNFQPDLSKCKLTDKSSPYSNLIVDEEVDEKRDKGITANKERRGNDWPITRTASIVIPGLTPLDGSNVKCTGMAPVFPGETVTCKWKLEREGSHLFYSHGAPAGGEGDGGSLTQGLFGAVNVEPRGSKWYRSQVTKEELDEVWERKTGDGVVEGARAKPLEYDGLYEDFDPKRAIEAGDPVLNMLKCIPKKGLPDNYDMSDCYEDTTSFDYELIYGDLHAIVQECKPDRNNFENDLKIIDPNISDKEINGRYKQALHFYEESPSFREFTAIFHDELKTFYANEFVALETEFQLSGVKDGFGVNYGASGMGSLLIANRKGIGPSWNCVECFYEEFFLQSWANGDPALLEEYFDDPSNVFHSYLNDRIKYRNLHAGPKETHVFHLHAHQWLSASDEDRGSYLDSQTIGPMQGFEYEIYNGGLRNYGDHEEHALEKDPPINEHHIDEHTNEHHHTWGSGNRNRTPGDSIFHCHLYPHFAQGMWALWRVHDVLEDGSRTLPDGQPYAGLSFDPINKYTVEEKFGGFSRPGTDFLTGTHHDGTPIPAVVPLPNQVLPLLPTYGDNGMPGYPFYIAGEEGHRAPQPPLDFAEDEDGNPLDAGLPRHIFQGGKRGFANLNSAQVKALGGDKLLKKALALSDFSAHLETAEIKILDNEGEAIEKAAMSFHEGISMVDIDSDGVSEQLQLRMVNGETVTIAPNIGYSSFKPEDALAYKPPEKEEKTEAEERAGPVFTVNGASPQPGAPFADPCGAPQNVPRIYILYKEGDSKAFTYVEVEYDEESKIYNDIFGKGIQITVEEFNELDNANKVLYAAKTYKYDQKSQNYVEIKYDRDAKTYKKYDKSGYSDDISFTVEKFNELDKNGEVFYTAKFYIHNEAHDDYLEVKYNEASQSYEWYDKDFDEDRDITVKEFNHLKKKGNVYYVDPALTGFRIYDVSVITLDMVVNKAGWHDPQARINVLNKKEYLEKFELQLTNEAEPFFFRAYSGECITYHHTNRTPKDLERDDFQVQTPTDIIGQHIHLVKFDVTSSDGSANGFNYEDGTFAPDAVLERKCAAKAAGGVTDYKDIDGNPDTENPKYQLDIGPVDCPKKGDDHKEIWKALLDAGMTQTTVQRWFADPLLTIGRGGKEGEQDKNAWWMGHGNASHNMCPQESDPKSEYCTKDRTLRTVFTHDHFAPSSIQQHGFYSALLIEPTGSKWLKADGTPLEDGVGATAMIVNALDDETHRDHREFALAVADFALLYEPRYDPVNPETQGIGGLLCEYDAVQIESKIDIGTNLQKFYKLFDKEYELYKKTRKSEWFCSSNVLKNLVEDIRQGKTLNAALLSANEIKTLQKLAENHWKHRGRPVAPPQKPEAISKDHHDPYLVNYKNEPIPLRIGEVTQDNQQISGDSTDCGMDFFDDEGKIIPYDESIKKQRLGKEGDLAFVFSSITHGDPCTPILDAYTGEEMQIRLIQGAQEVQHMFTIEGRTFPRMPDLEINGNVENNVLAHRDNSLLLTAAQEIGISEHFEVNLSFPTEAEQPFAYRYGPRLKSELEGKGMAVNSDQIGIKDYLYHFGTVDSQWNGAWGFIRVHKDDEVEDLSLIEVSKDSSDPILPVQASAITAQGTNVTLQSQNSEESQDRDISSDLLQSSPTIGDRLRKLDEVVTVTEEPEVDQPLSSNSLASRAIKVESTDKALPASATPVMDTEQNQEAKSDEKSYKPPCSENNAITFNIVATQIELLTEEKGKLRQFYDPDNKIYDPNGLIFLPMPPEINVVTLEEVRGHYKYLAAKGKLEPLVLRVNAGDCIDINLYNFLLEPKFVSSEQKDRMGLPDAGGDALMPKIVPLNVDQCDEDEDKPPINVDNCNKDKLSDDVRPSYHLAISIPLPPKSTGLRDNSLYVGWNSINEPLQSLSTKLPSSSTDSKSWEPINNTTQLSFYAGFTESSNKRERECIYKQGGLCYFPYAYGTLPIKAFGDIIGHGAHGLFGTLIVEPEGATYHDPETNQEKEGWELGAEAIIHYKDENDTDREFREFVVAYQDGLNFHWKKEGKSLFLNKTNAHIISDCPVCDDSYDFGEKGVNYKSAPFWARLRISKGRFSMSSQNNFGPKSNLNHAVFPQTFFFDKWRPIPTPTFVAYAGEEVRFRVVQPHGRARQRAFLVYGHDYYDLIPKFGSPHSALVSAGKALNIPLEGPVKAGCYLYRDGPSQMWSGGVWGSFHVYNKGGSKPECAQ